MMVSGPHLSNIEGEMYIDSEELGEEEEEEEEDYSDEIIDEFGSDEVYVPRTFEDFQTMFKNQQEVPREETEISPSSEPQSVDQEMEKRVEQELMKMPEKVLINESPEPKMSPEEPISQEDDYEPEEPEELSGRNNYNLS